MRRRMMLAVLIAALTVGAHGGGFSSLRSPARDLGLGEGGGAALQGPDRALVNPGALSVTAASAWIEAGDYSGVRQQRVGLGLRTGDFHWGLDLGLDSVEGLEQRDAQGALLGHFGVQAPWALAAVAHDTGWGHWGLAAGARDRRWLGADYSPELALGWAWPGPLAMGATVAWRDLAWEGQASLAWLPLEERWGLEGGPIFQGQETRYGLGAQWQLWPGLALHLGWTRWVLYENQRWSLGLGWQGPSNAMAYAWVPGAAVGSAQKLSVLGRLPQNTATSTPSPTPSPTETPTPPSPTPTEVANPKPTPSQVEMDFVLPK